MKGELKARAGEINARLGIASFEDAYKRGMNLSTWLEEEDLPEKEYGDGLTAFERQLKLSGIITRSDVYGGYRASMFKDFLETDATRALACEWMATVYRNAQRPSGFRAAIADLSYGSDDYIVGSAYKPYIDAAREKVQQIAPSIPIAELVAFTTPINGNSYRSVYLDYDEDQLHFVRVGESADVPAAKLTHGSQTIDLYKYGRRLVQSYEVLRNTTIDVVARHIAWMAVQAEVDKLAVILPTMINGDGNANTAASVDDLTDLDAAATADTITLKAWIAFKLQFENPYSLTHLISRKGLMLDLMLLPVGDANSGVPLVSTSAQLGIGGFTPINKTLSDGVRYGTTEDAPADQYIGFDARFAIEQVTEIGSSISEVQRFIRNQTQELVMTETEGYAVFDQKATRILDTTA